MTEPVEKIYRPKPKRDVTILGRGDEAQQGGRGNGDHQKACPFERAREQQPCSACRERAGTGGGADHDQANHGGTSRADEVYQEPAGQTGDGAHDRIGADHEGGECQAQPEVPGAAAGSQSAPCLFGMPPPRRRRPAPKPVATAFAHAHLPPSRSARLLHRRWVTRFPRVRRSHSTAPDAVPVLRWTLRVGRRRAAPPDPFDALAVAACRFADTLKGRQFRQSDKGRIVASRGVAVRIHRPVLRSTAPHIALFMTTKSTGRSCKAEA